MVLTDEYSFNPDTQKINECITRINDFLPHILNRFHSFITELTTTYSLETQSNFKLHMDPNNPETWIDFTLQKDYRKVDLTIGFNKQLAFIHTINLYSSLGEEQDSYQITIPSTTTQITVDGSSDYFHNMYANDSVYFEYGASNKQATDFISKFIATITNLNLEIR